MNSLSRLNIGEVEPKSTNFQLLFEIVDIINVNGDQIYCRIVDETGIANAFFNKFASKLKKGGVFLMTGLVCSLIDGSIRIEMSANTQISKQPDKIIFKDKSNDISKKKYPIQNSKDEQKKVSKAIPKEQTTNKLTDNLSKKVEESQHLIPFTKEQAIAQLKQKKEFDELFKRKNSEKNKQKDKGEFKEKEESKNQKNYRAKEQLTQKQRESKREYEESNKKKSSEKSYKPKQSQYKEKNVQKGGRIEKAKSLLYKQKIESSATQSKSKNYKQKIEQKPVEKKKQQKEEIKNKKNGQRQNVEIKYQTSREQISHSQDKDKQKKLKSGKKENQLIEIIKILDQVGKHVQLKAFVTQKLKKVEGTQQIDRQIADSTGSVWLRTSKFHLENKQVYEFQNLQVVKEYQKVFLKESELSEAKRIQTTIHFNLRDINGKQ